MLSRTILRSVSLTCQDNQFRLRCAPLGVNSLIRFKSRRSRMCSDRHRSALILLAPGSEEMEFVIAADVLRRAGINVTVGGLAGSGPTKCSRDVVIVPDMSLADAIQDGPYDAVVLPGGLGGAEAFCKSADVGKLLQEQEKSGRLVAAICAAPTALKAHKIALGKSITSYPSMKSELEGSYNYKNDRVVEDGNIITSQGPATAFDFALAVSSYLMGKGKAQGVAKALLYG